MENKRVTTSIKIDPEIWKKAKIYSIQKGIQLSELIELLLKKEVEGKK